MRDFVTAHTSRNVATSGYKKGTGLVHWWRQAGHTPPVSNVFHEWPQVQDQRSSLRGNQPHSGHRMRGPEGSRLLAWSGSRSKTTDDLAGSSERAPMPQYYDRVRMNHGMQDYGSTKTTHCDN